MPKPTLDELLMRAVEARGHEDVERTLQEMAKSATPAELTLTIIANAGVHEIPQQYLRGEVYIASEGNWDAKSQDALIRQLSQILRRLTVKLRSRSWSNIYLVPTGHPVLSIQIKCLVYRLLRLNTTDLYYTDGHYYEVRIDHRELAIDLARATE